MQHLDNQLKAAFKLITDEPNKPKSRPDVCAKSSENRKPVPKRPSRKMTVSDQWPHGDLQWGIKNFAAILVLLAPCRYAALYTSPGKTALTSCFRTCYVLYVFQCYKRLWSELLHVYTQSHTYALLLTHVCLTSSNTNARFVAFPLSFTLYPTFGIHSHKTLDTYCSTLSPFKTKLKTHLLIVLSP